MPLECNLTPVICNKKQNYFIPQPPKGLITNSLVEIAIRRKAKLTFETK